MMKAVHLYRNIPTKEGTFGIFAIPELNWCCFSLENPWADNTPFDSCIPDGKYICDLRQSPRFGCKMYTVQKVPKRNDILIHSFNFVAETDGCIGLGKQVGYINGKKCLVDSRAAIQKFEQLINGERFLLKIRWADNG